MKEMAMLVFMGVLLAPWVCNFYKLSNCDFDSDYKCEVIHGVGVVVPPASYITVWFGDDSDNID